MVGSVGAFFFFSSFCISCIAEEDKKKVMTTYIHYYTLVGITTTYHKHWVNIIANEEYMLKIIL
jgi:hypothetical protein